VNNKLFFCADIGTSSLKAALIDSSGFQHGFARVPYKCTESAGPTGSAVSWLTAFYSAVEQLSLTAEQTFGGSTGSGGHASFDTVSALVISGNGPTLVPVYGEDPASSETMRPLYWYDRSAPLSSSLASQLPVCSSLFLPKVKTFINADPSAFAATKYFFSPQEWLSWKLGANPVTVIPHNGYLPYYWDEEQCAAYGVGGDRFPPFVKMGTVIGQLSPAAFARFAKTAAKLFAPGIPIVAGAADFIMALIGTGTLEPGAACDRTGSSEGINLCITQEDASRFRNAKENAVQQSGKNTATENELRLLPHAIEGLWNMGAVIPKSGTLFDQYRLSSGQSERPYCELTREIFADPSHPGKAVLETMGRAFVKALEDLEARFPPSDKTFTIKELVLSGGQCADPLWNQYKADISGRILKVPELIHAELAGNAVLAAVALDGGALREKAAAMIRIQRSYTPRE